MRPIRFIRRDGPRVFLDSRDLIRLLERSEPMSVATFAATLRSRNARIVLTFTNVAELVPQNESVQPDPARVRCLLDELERLPHICLRDIDVVRDEFRAAIEALEHGYPVRQVDPFVDHWWETAWSTPPRIARRIDRREDIELRDRLSLAAQVAPLLDDSRYLRFQERHRVALEETFAADRDSLGTSRGSHKAFEGAVARHLVSYGWPEPRRGMATLARFIRETPEACPGWRAGFDVWEEFRCNLNSKPRVNDLRDIAHVEVLPYVTHATLDRSWRSRCRQARDRLKKNSLWYAPFDRVYENVEEIIEAWGV